MSDQLKRFTLKRWILAAWALSSAVLVIATVSSPSAGASTAASPPPPTGPSFIEYESGQVRPIAMSPDGTRLFAVNTPNNTLEIFNITTGGLQFQARVPVGLEPCCCRTRQQ